MISTKTKLVSAIAMLLVATIMMTSASFAWFTISTAPEISNLTVKMSSTKNLEIAVIDKDHSASESALKEPAPGDAGLEYRWGATVSMGTAQPLVFPATATTGGICSVNYAADGRINTQVPVSGPTAFENGIGYYTANINGTGEGDDVNVTCAAVYGVWLRSNINTSVKVTTAGLTFKIGETEVTSGSQFDRLTSAASVTIKYSNTGHDNEPNTVIKANSDDASDVIALGQSVPTKVYVMVYFDGEYLTAADVMDTLQVTGLTVKFTSNTQLGTDDGTGTYSPLMQFGSDAE